MADDNFNFDEEVQAKQGKNKSKRNLKQYRDLSQEDFDQVLAQKALGLEVSDAFEKRISKKLDQFGQDYDLSDLKINDRETLRALIQALISLEDYEQYLYKIRSEGLNGTALANLEKLHKAMSELRADISKLQNDLNITRKVRKSDQDVSVMAYIDTLKKKAKEFYENKMSYIYCECGMLLATIWTLYPEEDKNKLALVCHRVLADGTECGKKTVVGLKEITNNRGTNRKEITPESML